MVKHSDYCTHIKNPEDKDILTRRLFDVNIRLMKTNTHYFELVRMCANYIALSAKIEKEGYKKPHGWSGANAGIPFNIIAVMRDGVPVIMLNPKVIKSYGGFHYGQSNCGSLTLENPVDVKRSNYIDIEYFDLYGKKIIEEMVGASKGGFTIQHEIEHNNGILIVDKSTYEQNS